MTNASARADDGPRAKLDWRGRLASVLLGTAGGGALINVLSNDYRWRLVAVTFGLGAIVAVASWLRRRPGAPIIRWGIKALLMAALAATVVGVVGPTMVVPWATGAASALTVGAALIPADRGNAMQLLSASTTIGMGTVIGTVGVFALLADIALAGVFGVGVGTGLIALGVSMLSGGPGHAALVVLGATISASGFGLLHTASFFMGLVALVSARPSAPRALPRGTTAVSPSASVGYVSGLRVRPRASSS